MPDKSGVSRRDLFQIIGSVPAIAAVTGGEAAAATPKAGPYKRQTFDDHQWHTVRVLCDLIIPADERSPGATEAGVPEFLDDWIAFRTEQEGNQDLRAEILGGLMWLDHESQKLFQKDFADASEAQQKQILDRIAYPKRAAKEDQPGASFFSELRILVIGGFFSSKVGVADLPYLGNVAVMEWKGCDPKVWSIIEERVKNGYKGILEAKPWGA
ncbi:MAG TPA: gluconate 2-dehydrogenase subunit 3 family protein [Bryobacteraceae bacterium]